MKKLFLFFAAVSVLGCSSDDDNPAAPVPSSTSFSYDGVGYQLPPSMGMTEIVMENVTDFNGESYDRSTLSVTGLNGTSSSATIAFDLYYKSGTSIAGTYNIHDSEADENIDFEDFLVGQNRACMGWISQGAVFTMATNTMISGNNPTGTVTVVVNGPNNYTLTYNGNFRLYEAFTFVRNMPASINVTSNVTQN